MSARNDVDEPLTPSHLLVGRRLLSLPDDLGIVEDDDEEFSVSDNILQKLARRLTMLSTISGIAG